MQNPNRASWVDVFLLLIGLLGLLAYWGISALMFVSGVMNMGRSASDMETAQAISLAVTFGMIGILLLPGLWTTAQHMSGRVEPEREAHLPFALWHIPFILIVWAGALLAGQWAANAPAPAWLLLPLVIPLCVIPPIWLVAGLAGRKYNFQPRWRSWNMLTIGSTLGPFTIMVAEVIILGLLVLGAVLFIIAQPELMSKLQLLSSRIKYARTEEDLFRLLGPLIVSRGFMGALLLTLSFLVPLIEEALKPLAVWLFSRQLKTRLDGFVLGAVCGTAYAIFETGGLGAAAGSDWLLVLGARGGTSLLHITTSAWMGSAIVPAIHERKWGQLLGVYAVCIFLHGTWNAFSIFSGLGGAAAGQPGAEWLVTAGKFAPFGMAALVALFLALVLHQQSRFQKMIPVPVAMETLPVSNLPPSEPENPETVIR